MARLLTVDDRVLQRILQGEVHRMNQGLVDDPVYLTQLLAMDPPRARTKSGGWHPFDAEVLRSFAGPLSPLVRSTVHLPLRFHVPHDAGGTCFLDEASAVEALQQHGAAHTEPRDGRLWMSVPLAQRLAQRWPTLVQFVRG